LASRHLTNTIKPSVCSGDAALCQITLTSCYVNVRAGISSASGGGVGGSVSFSLVGQTPFRPRELRFHQVNLTIDQFIAVEPGDVLGLYAPKYNPLPWTSVPCADARQRPLVSVETTSDGPPVVVGRRLTFVAAPPPSGDAPVSTCRQYSFSALLGQLHGYIGSRPRDHYFRSVCLSVCLCRVFLSRL